MVNIKLDRNTGYIELQMSNSNTRNRFTVYK